MKKFRPRHEPLDEQDKPKKKREPVCPHKWRQTGYYFDEKGKQALVCIQCDLCGASSSKEYIPKEKKTVEDVCPDFFGIIKNYKGHNCKKCKRVERLKKMKKFCKGCGTPLRVKLVKDGHCPHCGRELYRKVAYCKGRTMKDFLQVFSKKNQRTFCDEEIALAWNYGKDDPTEHPVEGPEDPEDPNDTWTFH